MKKLLILFVTIGCLSLSHFAQSQDMVVVTNSANPVSSMKKIEVKLYYMKKIKKSWPDLGKSIMPVGLSTESPIRADFLKSIMKMSQAQLDAYFQQVQFSTGDPVPPLLESEEEVLAYVEANEGALGYVSRSSLVGRTKVKIIEVR